MGNLRDHAEREMQIAGVDDDIYGDLTSKAVLELIDVFDKQGHSGMSASLVVAIFTRVVNFENLTPLTNDPDEWYQHGEANWQNSRNSSAFSQDQGNSYYLTGEAHWETDENTGRRVRQMTYYATERTYTPPEVEITEAETESDNG